MVSTVAHLHRRLQDLQLALELVGRQERLVRAPDAWMLRRLGVGADQQLLVEFLARAQPRIGDGDVAIGIVSGL